jgi:hypothetical protein
LSPFAVRRSGCFAGRETKNPGMKAGARDPAGVNPARED